MIWCKELYLGESIIPKEEKIIRKLKNKKVLIGKKIIVVSPNKHDMLEIIPGYVFAQKYYKNKNYLAVGVCSNTSEVNDILLKILDDCYKATNTYNVKQFFNSMVNK